MAETSSAKHLPHHQMAGSPPDINNKDCVVLICKVPAAGRCKTRLAPFLGHAKAAELATAMLQDVLSTFAADRLTLNNDNSEVLLTDSYWFFSPHEEDHAAEKLVLSALSGSKNRIFYGSSEQLNEWKLEANRHAEGVDLNLGDVLLSLLISFTGLGYRSVTFIGGDTPYLSRAELLEGIRTARNRREAYICPSTDGGYVMLTVPTSIQMQQQTVNQSTADSTEDVTGAFCDVRWSTEYTCTDQIVSLRRCGINVRVGRTYTDIDEAQDLHFLVALHGHAVSRPSLTADIIANSPTAQRRRTFSLEWESPEIVQVVEEECGDWDTRFESMDSVGESEICDGVTMQSNPQLDLNLPLSPIARTEAEWEHVSENSLGYGQYSIVSTSGSDHGFKSTAQKLHLLDSRSTSKYRSLLPTSTSRSFLEKQQYAHNKDDQCFQQQHDQNIDENHIKSYSNQCEFTQRFIQKLLS